MTARNNVDFDSLLKGNDEVVYNLVSYIREQDGARLHTDGRSYLTAQTNANRPAWVYVNEQADKRTEQALFAIFSEALHENDRFSVNAQEGFAEETLSSFAKQRGLKISKRKINAYFIREVREIAPVGRLLVADGNYVGEIARIVQQASIDDCDGEMTDEEAMGFAETHADSGNLFLWEHGKIVSMARIVRYGTKFARITSVGTERAARGNGFAKMLVGELAKRLLAEGLTPVIYARSENPSSNRCYQKIGFEKAGEICEFKLEK